MKKTRARGANVTPVKGKAGTYWSNIRFDSKGRVIPSSVDSLYNTEYFDEAQVYFMAFNY